jgi:hypothetical protein
LLVNLQKGRALWFFVRRCGDTGSYPHIDHAEAHGLVHIQFIFPHPLGDFVQHTDDNLAWGIVTKRHACRHGQFITIARCHRCCRCDLVLRGSVRCGGFWRVNRPLLLVHRAWPEQQIAQDQQAEENGCQDIGQASAHYSAASLGLLSPLL